jgi:hypothetical protein
MIFPYNILYFRSVSFEYLGLFGVLDGEDDDSE